MEQQPVPEKEEIEDKVSNTLPPFVYEGALEKQKQFVEERKRKQNPVLAANDVEFGEEELQSEQVVDLPYSDRDDDELEQDENGDWQMKKYKDV